MFIVMLMLMHCGFSQNLININSDEDKNYMEVKTYEGSDSMFYHSRRVREINVIPLLQNEEKVHHNDTILLDLFNDKQYKATVEKVHTDVNGVLTIRAKIVGYDFGYCFISTYKGKSFLTIDIPEKKEYYTLKYDQKTNMHYLMEMDASKQKPLEGGPSIISPKETRILKNNRDTMQVQNPEPFEVTNSPVLQDQPIISEDETSQDTIKLLIVYTPAAAAWASANETNIETTISSFMAKADLALENSNTYLTLELVHSSQVEYTETNSVTDLYNLQDNDDGYMDNVHAMRNEHDADLVVLLEQISYAGGQGFLLPSLAGMPDYGFSLSRIQQASWTYTVIHEIGHNLGCHHHKLQNTQPGPNMDLNPYSAGWRWTGTDKEYCSIMTYESGTYFADGITHYRVPYFSNPDLQYQGVPTGDAEDGDNARTIRETKSVVASYRDNISKLSDSLALVALYNATDGENWTHHENWLTGPINTWYGIYLSGMRVSYIDLDTNNLTGSLPSEIGNLSGLQVLLLNNNQLTGSIPPEIGNLSDLQYLYLYNNQLSGTIPSEIGNLSTLKYLCLHINQLTGNVPSEIENLSNLQWLQLNNNQLTGSIPENVRSLIDLTHLVINNNYFENLPALNTLSDLSHLYIGSNKFTFEDIEPNIGIPSTYFSYTPQANIGEEQGIILFEGDAYSLSVTCGGTNNLYQWYKGGILIPGANSAAYLITGTKLSDAGDYTCRVTNTVATALTIYSMPFHVSVYEIPHDQTITLNTGWNIFSLAVQPDDINMKTIVQPLIDAGVLIKVQDETGNAIENVFPIGWVNNIGDWSLTEGYKIKVTVDTQLVVTGLPVPLPASIDLGTGWNISGYPLMEAQGAQNAVSTLVTNGTLIKVQDESGIAIEYVFPIGWVYDIVNLEPGKGYKIKVSGDDVLILEEAGTLKSALSERHTLPGSVHFKPVCTGKGYDHMNIYLVPSDVDGTNLQPGDEIGIFDGDRCVGAAVISSTGAKYLCIAASADDHTTAEIDGFTKGNGITFRLWKAGNKTEIAIKGIEFLQSYDGLFEPLGTTVAGLTIEGDGISTWATSLGENYPNPFTTETTIPYFIGKKSEVNITIYNLLGQQVKTLVHATLEAGSYKVTWDGTGSNNGKVGAGFYLCRMTAGENLILKKIEHY